VTATASIPRACALTLAALIVLGPLAAADSLLEPAAGAAEPGFVHFNGMVGQLYFPEMTGQGAGFLDYDGDGDHDLYLVQGAVFGVPEEGGQARPQWVGPGVPRDVLLRNDTSGGEIRWVDVTAVSGIVAEGYGMAVAVGDVDGDGWKDLLTGNYGANQLWRNRGDGTFEEATARLAEEEPRWTTSAVFGDFDGDGLEDLYIVNYVHYSMADPPDCYAASSRRDYCGPSGFASQRDRFLRNNGGGFEDVSGASGIGAVAGSGLGVNVLDADGDGRLELYVSNDGQPNFLWHALGGRWVDDALLAGVAVNRRGEPEASMGIAVGDLDRDGDEDLVVTHLAGESHTLYVNQGDGLFDDRTREAGLAAASLPYTGFGVAWLDLEHDGWLDLAVVNGAVRIQERADLAGDPYPLGQVNQLFANRNAKFEERGGESFSAVTEVSRGLVRGDVDNDGDHDLLVTNSSGPARLFLGAPAGAMAGGPSADSGWLGVSFAEGSHQSVTASYEGGERFMTRASSAGSYASAADSRALVTGRDRPLDIAIAAPAGTIRLNAPPLGRYLRFP
jgi:hypothetical protein